MIIDLLKKIKKKPFWITQCNRQTEAFFFFSLIELILNEPQIEDTLK